MIHNFKFFSDNDEEKISEDYVNLEGVEIASWMWYHLSPSNYQNYEYVTVQTNGIIEFLRLFHPQQIVPVYSLVGGEGMVHTGREEYEFGWGFNIQTDPIVITYLRYNG